MSTADPPPGAVSPVDARGGQGVQAGDYTTQTNNFYIYRPGVVSWPVRVGAVPELADAFQTRSEMTALTEAADSGEAAVLTQVFSGMGGVGKSQLAAAYARSWADRVDVVVWVTAATRDAVIATYAHAAVQVGVAAGGDGERAAVGFLGWLQSTARSWLIVLDDVADPVDLRGLWPTGPQGWTVITTRRRDAMFAGAGRRRIDVGLFSAEQAQAFLYDKLDGAHDPARLVEAGELAAELGFLPLALAQAAAFMADRGESCAGYRVRLADRGARLGELFPVDAMADDYQATVAATWSVSIEAADQLAPVGVCSVLLQVVAVLDPNGFPADLVQTPAVTEYVAQRRTPTTTVGSDPGEERDEAAGQDIAGSAAAEVGGRVCRDGLHHLARLSLLQLGQSGSFRDVDSVRVHALVQRAVVERLSEEALAVTVRTAASALVQLWPEIERDSSVGQTLRANAAMLEERYSRLLWQPDAHPVLWRAGRSLGECGLVAAAVAYWDRMGETSTAVLGPGHPDTLSTRYN